MKHFVAVRVSGLGGGLGLCGCGMEGGDAVVVVVVVGFWWWRWWCG